MRKNKGCRFIRIIKHLWNTYKRFKIKLIKTYRDILDDM